MNNALVKILGWKATVLHGDPSTYDRWQWLKRYLLPGPSRTLEAGCGSGAFSMFASRIGNHTVGISNDKRNNHVAQVRAKMLGICNVEFLEIDLRTLGARTTEFGTFDQIICFETIEHIVDDRKLMRDLSLLLRPGGRLLLTAPFKAHKPLLDERLSSHEDGGHVRWGYTHKEIKKLFNDCGIDILIEDFVSGFVTQQLMNLMRILTKVHQKFAWVAIFPLRVLQILDRPLTNIINYPYLSIAVLGLKRDSLKPTSSELADK